LEVLRGGAEIKLFDGRSWLMMKNADDENVQG